MYEGKGQTMETMFVVLYTYVFVVGTCIASFINVVIYRVPLGLNFVKGRSFCPKCHETLKFRDMIPVLGWFLLKGKCRFCGERISFRYPAIEFVGGLLSILCFDRYGIDFMTIISFVFSMLLLAISMIDYDTMIIPDGLVIGCLVVACLSVPFMELRIVDRVVGFFIVSIPLCAMNVIVPDCFGGGDIKLFAVCGVLLGWKQLLVGTFIAILLAGVYASYLLVNHKVNRKGYIAFGPYICIGVFIALLYGNEMMSWYLNLIGI